MQEFLTGLYENSTIPWISALVLGLLTAVSPCPLATNITAIGYISRDIGNRSRVFRNGLVYTLGRAVSYTSLALILFIGADLFKISSFFQVHGEKILGPLLIVAGILMLGLIHINIPFLSRVSGKMESAGNWNFLNVLMLGMVFALAFCPYSGVLYFGLLIPMTISSVNGLYLPVVFALATGIPVILFAWLLAYAVSEAGRFYNALKKFELWMRKIIALLFIGVGIYYVVAIYF